MKVIMVTLDRTSTLLVAKKPASLKCTTGMIFCLNFANSFEDVKIWPYIKAIRVTNTNQASKFFFCTLLKHSLHFDWLLAHKFAIFHDP